MRYVTVYEVTRHYGGPEEGGWWYNWYAPVKTLEIPKTLRRLSHRAASKLGRFVDGVKEQFAHLAEGDISSVLGGVKVEVYTEQTYREFQSTARPHYE